MPTVYIEESAAFGGEADRERIAMHVEMSRVPVVGERITLTRTGRHTAVNVVRVEWKDSGDDFMPVAHVLSDE